MRLVRFLLFPFALVYDIITSVRNTLFDIGWIRSTSFKIPTIVVGNLSVGGTGKTPQIEYLINLLKSNYKVAVLSRGYGRKTTGYLKVDAGHSAEEVGDEPLQFFKKFKAISVAVDEARVHGITSLLKSEEPPEIVLLDDAYQHRKVTPGFSILLTKYDDLFVDDFLLPTGNLRESSRGANRADVLVVTKCPEKLSKQEQLTIEKKLCREAKKPVFFTTIRYSEELKGSRKGKIASSVIESCQVLLVTGIANPNPLLAYLETKNSAFKHLKFPDHYQFKEKDVQKIKKTFEAISSDKKMILTTEKDFVRLSEKIENLYFIEIETAFINQKDAFDNLIKSYVKSAL
ncbi:MAG: tetraacyldisaccharide 4'-kinase [Polaribacter sp.]|nr:tetraacyldisaccharide 4'-kinase [Polaribacter sp.]